MAKPGKDDTKIKAKWRTIQFLSDAPLNNDAFDPGEKLFNSDDAPRCEPIADQLARQLIDFIQLPNVIEDEPDNAMNLSAIKVDILERSSHSLGHRRITYVRRILIIVQRRVLRILKCVKISIDELLRKLWEGFKKTPKNPEKLPPRIGVFGGLGQGKTTVINWALWKTEALLNETYCTKFFSFIPNQWKQSWKVEWFDVAFYKSDELEYELDRLLGSITPSTLTARFYSFLAYGSVGSVILLVIFIFLLFQPELPETKTLIRLLPLLGVGAIIASLLKPWSYWWRSGQRTMTLGTKSWWRQGCKIVCGSIQILVIDNLDRANLKQQRAILRAIYKHHDQLGYALIIGFDETRLLASQPDPESPRELLRKSIHIEARMPVRVLTDTLRLAWMASSQAADINPDLPFLSDSRAVGALAQIMELISPIQATSPRIAKHMVNNGLFFLAHVQKNDQPGLDDWRAVLRLLALHTAVPQLRYQGDELKSALQNNQPNGLAPVLNLIFSVDDKENKQPRELAEQIFNATRMYNPLDLDWSPWVVLWATRAFAPQAPAAERTDSRQQSNSARKIPDFDSVNFLTDGLLRLLTGKPRTELSNLTGLLSGIPANVVPGDIAIIQDDVAHALLPLTGLLLIQLKQASERKQLLTELWAATHEGLLDWVFEHTDKGEFLVCLAEWALMEPTPWPVSSQETFTHWWHCLSEPDLNIPSTRRIRLLSLLPASRFHLADILAYAALAKDHLQHDLGPEHWLASYVWLSSHHPHLNFNEEPVQQFRTSGTGPESIKRFWPPLQVGSPGFAELLAEHCAAWRKLNLQGTLQQTPLEYLLLKDQAFADWLTPGKSDDILPALGKLFFDGSNWSERSWLDILAFTVETGGSSGNRHQAGHSRRTLRMLRSRFSSLWCKPAIDPFNLQVQILLSATFPHRKVLNTLAQQLPSPLTEDVAHVLIQNIRWWVKHCANIGERSHINNERDQAVYKNRLIQLSIATLSPDAWNNLFGGEGTRNQVPGEWGKLHQDYWHNKSSNKTKGKSKC